MQIVEKKVNENQEEKKDNISVNISREEGLTITENLMRKSKERKKNLDELAKWHRKRKEADPIRNIKDHYRIECIRTRLT